MGMALPSTNECGIGEAKHRNFSGERTSERESGPLAVFFSFLIRKRRPREM